MQILFATLPADGHFNPLTGLAVHLASRGHDVRWYTGPSYAGKLEKLGIPHFPFERANDVNGENLTERYPEYAKLGLGPKAIAFAVEKIFFANLEAHYRDVAELRAGFPLPRRSCSTAASTPGASSRRSSACARSPSVQRRRPRPPRARARRRCSGSSPRAPSSAASATESSRRCWRAP
ncbi:MAG: hypothetical protein M5U28_47645 [Sandaracinaceae bacterium]|nr:hypothetical protein [Sandaracinaceae bacterium]